FYSSVYLRLLPSFPTRRSSDLWNLNGVAGGPVALGDASVPFTITGCMGGTSVLDCVLMFKGNDGNVYGDIDINFTVSDSSGGSRSEEHTSELQSRENLVCRLLL